MAQNASPKLTPALTTSSHDTAMAADDPFLLQTPAKEDTSNTSAMSSFLFPSRSFEIERFTNIKDVVPEWEDDDVDEIMVLSPKSKMRASLSVVHETQESLASMPTVASFSLERSFPNSGDCSRVCLARHTETNRVYAVKTYAKSTISYDTPTLEYAMKEQMMLRLLTHMNVSFIVKLRWSFQDEESMHIVTDYCPSGDMRAYIECHGPLSPPDALILSAELADALCSLHSSDITHRRVRPEHILLDASGHILLTGFSNSSFSSPNTPTTNVSQKQSRPPHQVDQWDAPEVVLGWPQDCAIDIWSFGLLVWFMLTGKHPLLADYPCGGGAVLHLNVLSSIILHAPVKLEGFAEKVEVRDLVAWTVQPNARLRPSSNEVKAHPYFENIDWARLRKKQYTVSLRPTEMETEDSVVRGGKLDDLPESETLRGVHIAGFDFVYENPPQEPSRLDLSEGDFLSQNQSPQHSQAQESEHSEVMSEALLFPPVPSKRATFASAAESVYVTPAESINSEAKSTARSDASTAQYSCTSLGELRESPNAGDVSTTGVPDKTISKTQQEDPQPLKAAPSISARRASDSICPLPASDSSATLTRQNSALTAMPPSILRRDTNDALLSRSPSRSSAFGLSTTSRPPSALSLGGARGLRLRKYASLNFDLDTVVSLDNDDSSRPRSLNTSRRVSFVDEGAGNKTDGAAAANVVEDVLPSAPLSAPIGSGHPWSFRNFNNFRTVSPSWHVTPNANSSATPGGSGALGGNKLKKKQRTSSTPALPSMTPTLQDQVDLPEGLRQIGLGIGYTHTPSRIMSPRIPGFSGPAGEGARGPQTPTATSTPGRRTVSLVGTTSAIQRCASIFSGLRNGGKQGERRGGPGQLDALVERASEESDALEAVMREMYGSSWTAEGGSPYGGGGSSGNSPANVKRPGKVYSVPGMPGMTETLSRARGNATSSTLRLVERAGEGEL